MYYVLQFYDAIMRSIGLRKQTENYSTTSQLLTRYHASYMNTTAVDRDDVSNTRISLCHTHTTHTHTPTRREGARARAHTQTQAHTLLLNAGRKILDGRRHSVECTYTQHQYAYGMGIIVERKRFVLCIIRCVRVYPDIGRIWLITTHITHRQPAQACFYVSNRFRAKRLDGIILAILKECIAYTQ